jgi:small-conductance mechanosensitive channel/CRP-like cAMP-binding protein
MNAKRLRFVALQIVCVVFGFVLIGYSESIINIVSLFGNQTLPDVVDPAVQSYTVLAFAWLAHSLIDIFIWHRIEEQSGYPVSKLLKDIVSFICFFTGILIIAAFVFEKPVTGLWATSGVAVVVIGFALKQIISDVFSGIALNLEHSYRIGDWVEFEMESKPRKFMYGQVVEVNWRATHLLTRAQETIVIPNSLMAGMKFINYSAPEKHYRAEVLVSLSHTIPVDRVKRILMAAIKKTPGVMGKLEPEVILFEFNERGVVWAARFWVSDFHLNRKMVRLVHENILRHLQIAGIPLSYTRVDRHALTDAELEIDSKPSKESLLKRTEMFDLLGQKDISILSENMAEHTFNSGDYIVRQGSDGTSLFIVAEGLVDILALDTDGNEKQVTSIEPGNYFGEMSLLTGQVRRASAKTRCDTLCFEIDKKALMPILTKKPELLDRLSDLMAERRYRLNELYETTEKDDETAEKENFRTGLLNQMKRFFAIKRQ